MFRKFQPNILSVDILLIIFIIALGIFLGGGFLQSNLSNNSGNSTASSSANTGSTGSTCCDSGDGGSCHPLTDASHPTLTYNNQQYGLLTSAVHLPDPCHMTKTSQTFEGNPIVINSSEHIQGECSPGDGTKDQIDSGNCATIPNDQIVYVCIGNCYSTPASFVPKLQKDCGNYTSSYGDDQTTYAVYFRLSDYPKPGIPRSIAYCQPYITGTPVPVQSNPQPTFAAINVSQHESLQLNTFIINNVAQTRNVAENAAEQPYCKPAIYLYPQQKEQVSIRIAPKGKLLTTIPQYPASGWHVIASPDGTITTNGETYPYLFYEARVPDNLIPPTNRGYVISFDHLSSFFNTLLPQTGLNQKEQQAFADYWLQALPHFPYYKITIIPQSTLDFLSPLFIAPTPQTIIRVTLDFQPLDHPEVLFPPTLPIVKRTGFTVVEWAGMYKKDKNHSFTCLQ